MDVSVSTTILSLPVAPASWIPNDSLEDNIRVPVTLVASLLPLACNATSGPTKLVPSAENLRTRKFVVDSIFSITTSSPFVFFSLIPPLATSALTPVVPDMALMARVASPKFVDENLNRSVTAPLIKSLHSASAVPVEDRSASVFALARTPVSSLWALILEAKLLADSLLIASKT